MTEPEYLRGLQRACRNPRVTIEVAKEHGVPMTLVRIAKEYKEDAEAKARREGDDNLAYDCVWCVFDVDDHPAVGEADVMARDNGIHLAISNPCIELWLLLHFSDNPGMQHRDTIRQRLKDARAGLREARRLRTYSAGYAEAVARATKMDRDAREAQEPHRNPTTGVYELTELIGGQGDTTSDPR